jgi:hypothetical protein
MIESLTSEQEAKMKQHVLLGILMNFHSIPIIALNLRIF